MVWLCGLCVVIDPVQTFVGSVGVVAGVVVGVVKAVVLVVVLVMF